MRFDPYPSNKEHYHENGILLTLFQIDLFLGLHRFAAVCIVLHFHTGSRGRRALVRVRQKLIFGAP